MTTTNISGQTYFRARIDDLGRITVPKPLRDALGIVKGAILEIGSGITEDGRPCAVMCKHEARDNIQDPLAVLAHSIDELSTATNLPLAQVNDLRAQIAQIQKILTTPYEENEWQN